MSEFLSLPPLKRSEESAPAGGQPEETPERRRGGVLPETVPRGPANTPLQVGCCRVLESVQTAGQTLYLAQSECVSLTASDPGGGGSLSGRGAAGLPCLRALWPEVHSIFGFSFNAFFFFF